jgi:hypothetical protein
MSRVTLVRTEDRKNGVGASLKALAVNPVHGKEVLIKPNEDIMKRKIFKQEQIARAVELGLGASSPSEIDVEPVNPESQKYCDRVLAILNKA